MAARSVIINSITCTCKYLATILLLRVFSEQLIMHILKSLYFYPWSSWHWTGNAMVPLQVRQRPTTHLQEHLVPCFCRRWSCCWVPLHWGSRSWPSGGPSWRDSWWGRLPPPPRLLTAGGGPAQTESCHGLGWTDPQQWWESCYHGLAWTSLCLKTRKTNWCECIPILQGHENYLLAMDFM